MNWKESVEKKKIIHQTKQKVLCSTDPCNCGALPDDVKITHDVNIDISPGTDLLCCSQTDGLF